MNLVKYKGKWILGYLPEEENPRGYGVSPISPVKPEEIRKKKQYRLDYAFHYRLTCSAKSHHQKMIESTHSCACLPPKRRGGAKIRSYLMWVQNNILKPIQPKIPVKMPFYEPIDDILN